MEGTKGSDIAHSHSSFIYLYVHILVPSLYICVYTVVGELLDYLLDITALSEREAQAFRYAHINIC